MKLSRKRGIKKRGFKKRSKKRRVQKGGFVGTFYNLAMMPLKIAGTVMNTVFTGVKTLVDNNNSKQQANNNVQQEANNNVQQQANNGPMPAQMNNNLNTVVIDNNTKSIIENNNYNIDTLKKLIKFKKMVNATGENMDIIHPIQSLQVVKLY